MAFGVPDFDKIISDSAAMLETQKSVLSCLLRIEELLLNSADEKQVKLVSDSLNASKTLPTACPDLI